MTQTSTIQLQPPQGDGDEASRSRRPDPSSSAPGEDLPYRVEIWDQTGTFSERLIAVTSSASVGYAAFYAAAREHPGRVITLRFKGGVLSRWTGHIH